MSLKDLLRMSALMFAFTGAVACDGGEGEGDDTTTDSGSDDGGDDATDSGAAE